MTDAIPAACAYCGLPLSPPLWGGRGDEATAGYCCFGCRFAAAVTRSRGEAGEATSALARLGLAIFLTMNVMVFSMALWTRDFYGAEPSATESWGRALPGAFRYLSLLFALPVLFLLGGPLLENALQSLRRGTPTTDLLLVLGVGAAYAYSAVSVMRDDGPVYFEVGCMVLVLVTLGRWLEATGKLRTTATLEALHRLLPESVRVVTADGETEVPLSAVDRGALVRVLPGERVPCDGVVRGQPATVEEHLVTGESGGVVKEPGDSVYGGSLSVDGTLLLEVTAPANAGTLARLVEMVRAALRSKGRYERLADRLTTLFLPAVVAIALAAFGWHATRHGLAAGILAGLAVILIACPCALGLATPMALWAALGRAAEHQVLFRHGEALERLATIRAVRLDKTGTLTTGAATVAASHVDEQTDRAEVMGIATDLAACSNHPHAAALAQFPARPSTDASIPGALDHVESRAGRGLRATRPSDGRTIFLGSPRWMQENAQQCHGRMRDTLDRALEGGRPVTCLGWDGRVRGVFEFQEQFRPEAADAIAQLRGLGLDVAVLTGDHESRGVAVARELGVPVEAALLPEEKLVAVARAQVSIGPTAMVGDGINDAPSLAGSDVGVALGCGADVSRESASVCLLGNDLTRLPWAVALARQTGRVVRQNLFWAFAYNIIGIGIACTGRLNPVVAALAMVLSSFLVVTNSLRLSISAGRETESPQPLRSSAHAEPTA